MDELLRLYPSPMQMKERLRVIDIATMAYPGRVDVAKLGRFMQILQRAIKSGDLASAGTARGVGQHSFAHTLVAREAFAAFLVKQNIKPEGQLEGWVNPDGETAATRVSEPEAKPKGRPGQITPAAIAYARSEIDNGRPKNEVYCETITKFDLDVKPDALRKGLAKP